MTVPHVFRPYNIFLVNKFFHKYIKICRLVGDISYRTILGFKWKTSSGNECSVPSEWLNEPTVWQGAIKFQGEADLGSGIPVGVMYNRVNAPKPGDTLSATKDFLAGFGFIFYDVVAQLVTRGGVSPEDEAMQLADLNSQLQSGNSQVNTDTVICSDDTASKGITQTCDLTYTVSVSSDTMITDGYSFTDSSTSTLTNKVTSQKSIKASLGISLPIFSIVTGSAGSTWEKTTTKDQTDKTTVSNANTGDKSDVKWTTGKTDITCKPQPLAGKGTYQVTFYSEKGTFSSNWVGQYLFVLDKGAKFNFTAGGTMNWPGTNRFCWKMTVLSHLPQICRKIR